MAWVMVNFNNDTENDFIGTITVQDDVTGFTYSDRVDATDQKGKDDFKEKASAALQEHLNKKSKRDTILADMLTEMNKGG